MGILADNFYPPGHPLAGKPLSGADVINRIRQDTDTILVSFSYGKDSIGAYLAVRDHFPRVIPFFAQLIPDLEFVERRLQYYEQMLDTHIVRVHSPHFFRMLRNSLWQPPHRVSVIDAMELPEITYDTIAELVALDAGIDPQQTFTAVGVRASDSVKRRTSMAVSGAINWKRRVFYPVWDVSNAGLRDMIRVSKMALPVDYRLWGTSFDGINHFFLKEVRDHYPDDYARILEWFPFADMEFFRRNLQGGGDES